MADNVTHLEVAGSSSRPSRVQPIEPQVTRKRMTALERREQLIYVGKALFAVRGYEAVTIEEIAAQAEVSKPVIYEHFGGIEVDGKSYGAKESLYAVIVDREIAALLHSIEKALDGSHPRIMLEQAAVGFLTYIEQNTDGFQILVRDSPMGMVSGSFSSLITDIAMRVQHLLASEFRRRKFNAKFAPLYAQSLVGMVALTGQWWVETKKPSKEEVASHLVNLAWNGLAGLETKPELKSQKK